MVPLQSVVAMTQWPFALHPDPRAYRQVSPDSHWLDDEHDEPDGTCPAHDASGAPRAARMAKTAEARATKAMTTESCGVAIPADDTAAPPMPRGIGEARGTAQAPRQARCYVTAQCGSLATVGRARRSVRSE